jgi:hypothetical protein
MWFLIPKTYRIGVMRSLYYLDYYIYRDIFSHYKQHTWFTKFFQVYKWIMHFLTGQSQCFRILNLYCLAQDSAANSIIRSLDLPYLLEWLEFTLFYRALNEANPDQSNEGNSISTAFFDTIFLSKVNYKEIDLFSINSVRELKLHYDFLIMKISKLRSSIQQSVNLSRQPVTSNAPALDQLWLAYFGNKGPQEQPKEDKKWTLLGFQQDENPCSDFRAMGNLLP